MGDVIYRIRCLTDEIYEYTQGDEATEPLLCPTNSTHTIDSTMTAVVEKVIV